MSNAARWNAGVLAGSRAKACPERSRRVLARTRPSASIAGAPGLDSETWDKKILTKRIHVAIEPVKEKKK